MNDSDITQDYDHPDRTKMSFGGRTSNPADPDAERRRTIGELAKLGSSAAIRNASKFLLATAQTNDSDQVLPDDRRDWAGGPGNAKKSDEEKNPLLTGQSWLNPCYPCRSCCRGKFTLRTGCYVISSLLCVS